MKIKTLAGALFMGICAIFANSLALAGDFASAPLGSVANFTGAAAGASAPAKSADSVEKKLSPDAAEKPTRPEDLASDKLTPPDASEKPTRPETPQNPTPPTPQSPAGDPAKKLQIISAGFFREGDLIKSRGAISLQRPGFFARAQSGSFDAERGRLELSGDVFISSGEQNTLSQHAVILIGAKEAEFSDVFLSDGVLQLWLRSEKSSYKNGKFITQGSVTSSCASDAPEWQIDFSRGEYDRSTYDLSFKNMIFRYRSVPIFWLPYFRINVDERRKSGLLTPDLAIKPSEGIFYEQPLFIAFSHASDLELRAQLRTNRGAGSFARFRWADSPTSQLVVDLGYFKERGGYAEREQLKYSEHFGGRVHYEREQLWRQNPAHQEGLYLDFLRMNDIDYLNLYTYGGTTEDFLITSKFNYFYTNNKDFYGLYARLYQDTTKTSQNSTVQEFPTFQFHRFFGKFGVLDYKMDAVATNYYSPRSGNLSTLRLKLPLSYKLSLPGNLLNIALRQSSQGVFLSDKLDEKAVFYELANEAKIYANWFKNYSQNTHHIDAGVNFSFNSASTLPVNEFFQNDLVQHGLGVIFSIDQFFTFGDDGGAVGTGGTGANSAANSSARTHKTPGVRRVPATLHHSIRQEIRHKRASKFEHSVEFDSPRWGFWNNTVVDFERSSFKRVFTGAYAKFSRLRLSGGMFYNKRSELDENLASADLIERYAKAGARVQISDFNELFGAAQYDLSSDRVDNYSLGFLHKRRCMNFTIEYRQQLISKLTQSGARSQNDRGVYLRFNLYPIGGVRYNISLGDEHDI